MKEVHLHVRFLLIAMLLSAFPATGNARLPSVKFDDMARSADCIVIAEPVPKQPANEEVSEFRALAIVAGTRCTDHGSFTVTRTTSEMRTNFLRSPVMLFLKFQQSRSYVYANEPFGALGIKDGSVSTLYFTELQERVPIESLLQVIQQARISAEQK